MRKIAIEAGIIRNKISSDLPLNATELRSQHADLSLPVS